MDDDLGDAGPEVVHDPLERAPAADAGDGTKWSGNTHALLGGQPAEREPDRRARSRRRQPEGQAELDRELEVDVEELGPQLQGAHVASRGG